MSKLLEAASAEDLDVLYGLWLESLEGDPPWREMGRVLKVLHSTGRPGPAEELLELVIAERESEGGEGFESFLLESAEIFHVCEPLRKALVELLRDRHLMFQPLELFLKTSGLRDQGADVAGAWRKLRSLMKYRDGGYLYHPAFGTGRISRISRTHVTVDFPEAPNHDIQLEVALDTTIPLDPSSLAVLASRDPQEFMDLVSDSPGDFLERLLDEPFTGSGGSLSKDGLAPLAYGGNIDLDELWKAVRKAAASTGGFADLGGKVVALDEGAELVEQLRTLIRERKVSVSKKVHRIQSMLKSYSGPVPGDLTELLPEVTGLAGPETGALFELSWILSGRGAAAGFQTVRKRFTETSAARAERALGEIRSQSCRRAYIESFLSETEDGEEKTSLLSCLRRSLWEHAVEFLETSDPEFLSACIGSFLSRPSDTELFLWSLTYMATRHGSEGIAEGEEPGYGVELFLDNLFYASADTQKRVIGLLTGPLREELNRFLDSIDTRRLNRYIETYDASATAHNEGLFLVLGRELSRRRSTGMRRSGGRHFFWEGATVFSSREAIQDRQEDIRRLKQEEIPAAAEAIGVAASHGDLSENAEYSAAIEKRDLLLDRLKRWSEELQSFSPYPVDLIGTNLVSPGVRVTLQDTGESEEVQVLEVVGPLDSDPELGRINYMAPLGRVLLGRSQGDVAELPGSDGREWRIVSIEVLEMVGNGQAPPVT
ncbi:MAG: hypothetical protein AVO35_01775 [Candidatus Aegiribacteria sp. MLS_C]|nr:MAG: hypothetical protein AVO35_01775 [Candidatus Aegiribacteria sp. MLS_C]